MRRRIILALVLVVVIGLIGALLYLRPGRSHTAPRLNTSALSKLPQHAEQVAPMRLAAGLIPPTNRWFSSLVFSTTPQPVFAYPLSYKPTQTGFELDAPEVTGTANTIFASHRPTLRVNLGTDSSEVVGYDDLSVTVAQQASGRTVALTRLVQGSPFAFVSLPNGGTVQLDTSGTISSLHANARLIKVGDQTFGVVTSGGSIATSGGNLTLHIPANGRFTLFAMPTGANVQTYYADAQHPVTSTSVSYSQSVGQLSTTYQLNTKNGPTLFAANPNLPIDHPNSVSGSFQTLLGNQTVSAGNRFVSSQASITPPTQLNLSKLSAADRATLIAQVNSDATSLSFSATDTYYAGKQLYRAANLLQLAHQLNQTAAAAQIQAQLQAQLLTWYNPTGQATQSDKYFYYDSTYKGIVGVDTSFGSGQFNDHHFHYGYFIYASAILAQYDHSFYVQAQPMVNLLISDIASPQATSQFPKLRVFDAYAGHSWASGNGDFNDGNNQESSSEATDAWYAIYLWGGVAHDPSLQLEGQWLYQLESTAATNLYLHQSGAPIVSSSFVHPFVSLVWGGKLDYATFFSANPQDLLGIQLIPMSPGQEGYLSQGNQAAITRNLAAAVSNPNAISGDLSDYLIMYQALSNPAAARANLAQLSPADIDSADSLSYLEAWVFSQGD